MAFNTFGQILRQGGEIALAVAKGLGYEESRIARLIENRLRPDSDETRRQIEQFSDDMIGAGRIVNALGAMEQIDLGGIPVNPYLFGDEPSGRRGLFIGEFVVESTGKSYRVDVELPDITTPQELFDAMNEEALRRVESSPSAFGLTQRQVDEITSFFLIAGERRF